MIIRRIFDKVQNQLFYYCGLAVFFAFFFMTVFGQNGILKLVELRRTMKRIDAENGVLLRQNLLRAQEIAKLKQDPDYLEQVARSRLGYVRDAETVFFVPED